MVSIAALEVAAVIIAFLSSGGRKSSMRKLHSLKTLGHVDDFQNGSVTAFRSDKLYLVRMNDGGFLALSLQCTHLGCAISWNTDKGEFDCPCHRSSFDMHGEVISPPAPRSLDTYKLKIESGLLKADLSHSIKRNNIGSTQLIYA